MELKNTMNAIKEILVNGGYITPKIQNELEQNFPKLKVCIKWGQAQREVVKLGEVREKIKAGESRGDYVREVFVPVDTLSKLQQGFGITDSDVSEYYHALRV
jgi:ribosomal protein S8